MVANILFFIFGILIGFVLCLLALNYHVKMNNIKSFNSNTNFFKSILKSIKENGRFIGRINNNVEISIDLSGDRLSVFLLMDKSDIIVLREQECIKISENSDPLVIKDIVSEIISKWKDSIYTVINMNGTIIDRSTYFRITNNFSIHQEEPNIKYKKVFNLDEILDRIGEIGFDNLSEEEKDYLKSIR